MRALRLSVIGTVTLALLGGMSGAVATQASEATEAEYAERAWATIRDGVFVDEAEWEERLFGFDPRNEKQARKLRRIVRNHLALLQDVPDYSCYASARAAAMTAAEVLDHGLTDILKGRRRLGETTFWEGQGLVNEYWELRGDVDCSAVEATDLVPDATPLELVELVEPTPEPTPWDHTPDRPSSESVGLDEPMERVTATPVTGETTEHWDIAWGDMVDGPELRLLDIQYGLEIAWSDPRLPSSAHARENLFIHYLGEGHMGAGRRAVSLAGTIRLDGPDGSWVGTTRGHGVEESSEQGGRHMTTIIVLEGEGAYDGLHAVLTATADEVLSEEVSWFEEPYHAGLVYEGFIYEGQVPAIPDPVEPGT